MVSKPKMAPKHLFGSILSLMVAGIINQCSTSQKYTVPDKEAQLQGSWPKSVRGHWPLWPPVASRAPPTTIYHPLPMINIIKRIMVNKITYRTNYKEIYKIRQTTAVNEIPQQRQQRRQPCPSWTSQRRPEPAQRAASQASQGAAAASAAATVLLYSQLQSVLYYISLAIYFICYVISHPTLY